MLHSYPWYIANWWQSRTRPRLSMEARGLFREILDICYHDGAAPDDEEALRRMTGCTEREWKRSWPIVRACLTPAGDGQLTNEKVRELLPELLEYQDARRKKSSAAAKFRWQREREKIEARAGLRKDAPSSAPGNAPSIPAGIPQAMPKQCPDDARDMPDLCPSSSPATSAPVNNNTPLPPSGEFWGRERQDQFLKDAGWVGIKKATSEQIEAIMALREDRLAEDLDLKSLFMIRARLWWFEEAWDAYWRKVDKKGARIAYLEAVKSLDLHDEIVAAILAQSPAMLARKEDARPHFATWIHHERWNDVTQPAEQGVLIS